MGPTEKAHDRSNLFRRALALERNVVIRATRGASRRPRGIHRARRDAVRAYVVFGELTCDAARKPDETMLRDGTVNASFRAGKGLHSAESNDAAAAVLNHRRDARLREI